MNNKIVLLTDYKGSFGSKWEDNPYRSGMDLQLLKKYFNDNDYDLEIEGFATINIKKEKIKDKLFIYTSSEDIGKHYKNYIEDIVLGIKDAGGIVVPDFKYLRAHENKVYMELLRENLELPGDKKIKTQSFGTLEEVQKIENTIKYPIIFKLASGSSGSTVELVNSKEELYKVIKKHCRTPHFKADVRDKVRGIKRKGYTNESLYRNKFILQSFLPKLENDWKVYVFFDKYYVFYRPVFKKRQFKASGGGYDNYFFGKEAKAPEGLFDFAEKVYNALDVPNVSLDIAFDGESFVLFEFQCLRFGTAGIVYSEEFYTKNEGNWVTKKNDKIIEKEYAESVIKYLNSKK